MTVYAFPNYVAACIPAATKWNWRKQEMRGKAHASCSQTFANAPSKLRDYWT